MFCVKCGAKLEEDSRFCSMCGAPVAAPEPAAEPASVEETVMTPVTEEIPAEPVAEEVPVEPVAEETPVEPVVEEVPVEPVAEETPVEPVVEEAPVEPVAEETPVEPVVEEAPVEPVAEETPVEPVVEEVPVEPVAEETPVEPVVEEPVAAPVVVEAPVVPVVEKAPAAPAPKQKKQKTAIRRKKPHIVLRILLQFLSFVMCIVLCAALVGTVVLADLNYLMSKNGIQQLVTAVINPSQAPARVTPVVGAAGVVYNNDFTIPEDLDISDIPEDVFTGEDMEENVSNLISWLYEQVEEASDKPLTVTEDQIHDFIQESNISVYVAEKLAGFADDFINNTENTTITTEEIMDVLEENERLIEEKFNTEITAEVKANLEKSVDKIVVEQDINKTIREQVFTAVENVINESVASTGMTWEQIQPIMQTLCSDVTLYIAIGVCVLLMLLIIALNAYNVPGGLTWIAVPSILLGGVMTAALAVVTMLPTWIPEIPAAVTQIIASFTNALLPIHASVLVLGVALLIVSIIWRIIRGAVYRKRAKAAT